VNFFTKIAIILSGKAHQKGDLRPWPVLYSDTRGATSRILKRLQLCKCDTMQHCLWSSRPN